MLVNIPNGGLDWVVDSEYQINWTPTGSYPWDVLIQYQNDTGGDWINITTASAGADGVEQSVNWTVEDDITPNAKIKITTQSGNESIEVNDTSNSTFRIKGDIVLSEPDGANVWHVDEVKKIEWTSIGW